MIEEVSFSKKGVPFLKIKRPGSKVAKIPLTEIDDILIMRFKQTFKVLISKKLCFKPDAINTLPFISIHDTAEEAKEVKNWLKEEIRKQKFMLNVKRKLKTKQVKKYVG